MKKLYRFAAVALAVSLALFAVSGCGPEKPKLYIFNWEDYIPDEVIDAFEKEFGVKLVYDVFSTNEELYAKLKSGGGRYDIVVPSGDYLSIMMKEGMLAEIDHGLIPNIKHLDPAVLTAANYDPDLKYSVPYATGIAGVSVNTKHVEEFEKSWRIFENPALKGRMTMLDDMREVMGAALKTLGYSVSSSNPEEVEAAKNLALEWKKNIVKFDAEAFGKGFAAGEFWAVHCYAESVFLELDEGAKNNVVFFIPEEGGPIYMDNMVILKDARNIELAHKFMNFIHEPKIYAQIMDYIETPSLNVPARDFMENAPRYEIEDMLANSEYKKDLGEHLEMYNKAWQEIRVGR